MSFFNKFVKKIIIENNEIACNKLQAMKPNFITFIMEA